MHNKDSIASTLYLLYIDWKTMAQKEKSDIVKGPFRKFVHFNTQIFESRFSSDKLSSIGILTLCLIRMYNYKLPDVILPSEIELIDSVNAYNSGAYLETENPPLVGLLFTAISHVLGNDVVKLRLVNELFGLMSFLLLNKLLKYNGVSSIVSNFGMIMILLENSLFTQFQILTTDATYLMFITFFIANNKLSKLKVITNKSWFTQTLLASIGLGLAFSSHWSGIFLLFYSFASCILELWYNSADLTISIRRTWYVFYTKLACYMIIPITIYLSTYYANFSLLTKAGESYNQISPEFQYSLQNNHLNNTFPNVKFGSSIMLRHYQTGKYLHSHPDYYAGSGRQQVTLLDNYNDGSNIFEILTIRGVDKNLFDYNRSVGVPWRVELLHVDTNSSLVIDEDHKPPISDQEYNKLVTTDTNYEDIPEENQKSKQQFQIKISGKYCKTDESKRSLQVVNSVFQIYNERESCYLLGTPLVLREGFSTGQNEVICITEPNYESSLWYIDWNTNGNFPEEDERISLKDYTFWDKLSEVLMRKTKKLFVGFLGYDVETHDNSIKNWMFISKGFTHYMGENGVVYLLGNFITYHLIIASIIIYGLLKIYEFCTFSPFNENEINEVNYRYEFEGFDYLVGYLMMLIPMTFVKIELHLFNYLPSLIFGILFTIQTYQWLFEKSKYLTIAIGIIVIPFIILAYYKFLPVMIMGEWTFEKCSKLMISPSWDSEVCEVYN